MLFFLQLPRPRLRSPVSVTQPASARPRGGGPRGSGGGGNDGDGGGWDRRPGPGGKGGGGDNPKESLGCKLNSKPCPLFRRHHDNFLRDI